MRKPTDAEHAYMTAHMLSDEEINDLLRQSPEDRADHCILFSAQAARLLNSSDPESRGKGFALIETMKKIGESLTPEQRRGMFENLYSRG
jgi:hypothetical protein